MSTFHSTSLLTTQRDELLDGPALTPPDGIEPNFDNPPNKTALGYGIFSLCLSVAVVLVLARTYVTWAYIKKVHVNDIMMLVAFGTYLAFVSLLFQQAGYVGYFVHQWDYRLSEMPHILYLFFVATNLFIVSITFIKGAILLEWLRLFHPLGTRDVFWWTVHIVLFINFAFYSASVILENLSCTPHEKIWNRSIPGTCFNSRPLDLTSAAISLLLDLVIFILPQRVIWSLQMTTKRKIGVAAVFMVGLIGCIAAIFRLAVTIPYAESPDATYTFCTVGLWTLAEMTCGVIVFCAPVAPKVASNLRFPSTQLLLEHWKSFTSSKQTNYYSEPGSSWMRTMNTGSYSRSFQEINDNDNVPLRSLAPEKNITTLKNNVGLDTEHNDSTILRTTVFTTSVEESSGMNRTTATQHPWVGTGRSALQAEKA
ncbi:hypothetical protein M426DRAFT_14611 [Hypoxylon sp. CI-4A]|nr:hypothetical protein M426DRAFT_14611 [Hypoxylon sp. CI-4A]